MPMDTLRMVLPPSDGGLHCGESEDHTERWVYRRAPAVRRRAPLRHVVLAADAVQELGLKDSYVVTVRCEL